MAMWKMIMDGCGLRMVSIALSNPPNYISRWPQLDIEVLYYNYREDDRVFD
jgi:hypothetical protein